MAPVRGECLTAAMVPRGGWLAGLRPLFRARLHLDSECSCTRARSCGNGAQQVKTRDLGAMCTYCSRGCFSGMLVEYHILQDFQWHRLIRYAHVRRNQISVLLHALYNAGQISLSRQFRLAPPCAVVLSGQIGRQSAANGSSA